MRISFICTVLNEEKTIASFLESLAKQTMKPDEVVIADGGSKDETVKIIESCRARLKNLDLIVSQKVKLNRSEGRNQAIQAASGEIIAASDIGCTLKENWLEEIFKPFKKNKKIEVVAGFYLPTGNSLLQKLAGELTSVTLKKINPETFLPSSRSIAFKKSAWSEVGEYPEDLNYCEDLVFALRLKKAGKIFAFSTKAIVFWPQKRSLLGMLRQFFNYSTGDGMAGKESPHFLRLWFKSYFFCLIAISILIKPLLFLPTGIFLFILFLLKSIFLSFKIKKILVFPLALLVLPILNLTVVLGFINGFLKANGRKS
jgi:glycosyltransferase involved in cell wall biosynthesis